MYLCTIDHRVGNKRGLKLENVRRILQRYQNGWIFPFNVVVVVGFREILLLVLLRIPDWRECVLEREVTRLRRIKKKKKGITMIRFCHVALVRITETRRRVEERSMIDVDRRVLMMMISFRGKDQEKNLSFFSFVRKGLDVSMYSRPTEAIGTSCHTHTHTVYTYIYLADVREKREERDYK